MAEKKQNNADGTVIIDTKINTKGAEDDLKKLKQELSQSADTAKASADKIENAFDGVDVSGVADGLGDSFEKETARAENSADSLESKIASLPDSYQTIYAKIEKIRSDDTLDNEQKADKIKDIYEALGQSQKKSQEKAWEAIKDESEGGSRKVIDNLDDIAQKAAGTGRTLKDKLTDGLDFSSLNGMIDSLGQKLGDMVGGSVGSALGGALGGAIGGAIGNLVADGLTQAAGALVDFGKESISLASDLEEVQNVVDVTFPRMSGEMDKFAKGAIRDFGMSETSAKKYASTLGAMAKSYGFTEKEAYEMATTMTKLTGDVASFYNLDHDEAFEKLKSVFTGETESLKAIGVIINQTTLDQFAMEQGLEKTTAEMTEQEKAALRYEFALAKLSDASGDFARSSDSWSNQTRILSQQWDNMKTIIGGVLIDGLKPLLVFATDMLMPALTKLLEVWERYIARGPIVGFMNAIEDLSNSMQIHTDVAGDMAVSEKQVQDAAESTRQAVEKLKKEYGEAREAARESIDSQIGLLTELSVKSDKTAQDILGIWKRQVQAMMDYSENMQKAMEMGLDTELLQEITAGSEEYMQVLDALVNDTSVSVDEINETFRKTKEAKDIVAANIADIQTGTSKKLKEMTAQTETEWGRMSDIVGESIFDMQQYIDSLTGAKVYVDVVERYSSTSGNAYTGNNSYAAYPSMAPYLASGTVIPPNAPYSVNQSITQSGGGESLSESQIRQIMFDALSENSGGDISISFNGDLAGLASVLTPVITREQRRNSRAGGG